MSFTRKELVTCTAALLLMAAVIGAFVWRQHTSAGTHGTVFYDTIITQKPIPPYTISQYDPLFREYGDTLGWDWKWLAAVAYNESRFHAEAANPSGAAGLMQLMPRTAHAMGVDSLRLTDPRCSVQAAARLFKRLENNFSSVSMPDRVCLVLASYNAGKGHVLDAMRLAEKYSGMRTRWEGNVEYFMRMLNEPAFYNDTLCHNGRFRGRETIAFVRDVQSKFNEFTRLEKLYYSAHKPDTTYVPRPDFKKQK